MKTKLMIIMMMVFSVQAMGCSCQAWEDAQDVVDSAIGVYIAIPTEDSRVIRRRLPPSTGISGKLAKTKMKIVKTYKGSTSEFVNVYHEPMRGTSCAFNYQAHEGVFVVMTYKVKGLQVTHMCSTSKITANNSMVTNFLMQL